LRDVQTCPVKPWRKIDERVVYERFRRVTSRRFELPSGEIADYEVIDLLDTAVILAMTAENQVLLVRQFRPGPEELLVELPGGVVEPGRSPIEVAAAELLEETGYRGALTPVGTIMKDAYATNTKHVFVATDCTRISGPEQPELSEPVLVPLEEFREYLRNGRLADTDAGYRGLEGLGLL
jgi:ADP-ribose pyrophosphatase